MIRSMLAALLVIALLPLAGCATTGGSGTATAQPGLTAAEVEAIVNIGLVDAAAFGADPAYVAAAQDALAALQSAAPGTPEWLAALEAANKAAVDLAVSNAKTRAIARPATPATQPAK